MLAHRSPSPASSEHQVPSPEFSPLVPDTRVTGPVVPGPVLRVITTPEPTEPTVATGTQSGRHTRSGCPSTVLQLLAWDKAGRPAPGTPKWAALIASFGSVETIADRVDHNDTAA